MQTPLTIGQDVKEGYVDVIESVNAINTMNATAPIAPMSQAKKYEGENIKKATVTIDRIILINKGGRNG
jgi:hypothetical protein